MSDLILSLETLNPKVSNFDSKMDQVVAQGENNWHLNDWQEGVYGFDIFYV